MTNNRGVVYVEQGKVEVRSIDYPKLLNPQGRGQPRRHSKSAHHQHLRL